MYDVGTQVDMQVGGSEDNFGKRFSMFSLDFELGIELRSSGLHR